MKNWALIAIAACIMVAAVIITAAYHYGSAASRGARSGVSSQSGTGAPYAQGNGSYNARGGQGSSQQPQSIGTIQPGTFTRLYVGQAVTIGNATIILVGVDRTSPVAILTVTSSSSSFNDTGLGVRQYLATGQGGGGPYVIVSQVSQSSSIASDNWANLTLSPYLPSGFSAGQWGQSRQQDNTSGRVGSSANVSVGAVSTEMRDQSLPACGASRPLFSVTPITEDNFTSFAPLGWVSPRGHVIPSNHGGFYMRQIAQQSPSNVTPANVSVFAPGNVTVFEIVGQTYLNSNHPGDYAIYFAPCANMTFYYGHVQELAGTLASAYAPPFISCQNTTADGAELRVCQKMVNVPFSTGEKMGNIGGMPSGSNGGVEALDMGVYDYTLPPAGFANRSRYDTEQLHASCPLNYFTSAIQDYIYGRIGIPGIMRTVQPLCGAFMEDVPGTAQGTWFQKGTPVPYVNEGLLISLMHNDFLPDSELFSIGLQANITGLAGVTYYFTPTEGNVNTDFANVTPNGQVHCYDSFTDSYSNGNSVSGAILLQMVDANTMRIEYEASSGCGSGPWSLGTGASTFYR